MRKRPVGFRHAVGVFLLLDCVSLTLGGQDQLRRQPLGHGLLGAGTRERDDPAHGQGGPTIGADLNRNLKRRTADPAALHLQGGLGVVHRLLEDRDPRLTGALLDQIHGRIEDSFCEALLTFKHQIVHELRYRLAVVAGIWWDRPLDGLVTPAHYLPPLPPAAPPALGRLAPYLDRLWRRSLTPAESSVPRTIW